MRYERIGDAQAFAYPKDHTLIVWECLLLPRYRDEDPSQDPALAALWQGVETALLSRFPGTTRLATPSCEPEYEQEQWQEFLLQRGYARFNDQAFVKECREAQP